MNTIQSEWGEYRKQVVPPDAGEVQLAETMNGFYAGASAALRIMSNISESDISTEAGVAIFDGLLDEVCRFVETLQK